MQICKEDVGLRMDTLCLSMVLLVLCAVLKPAEAAVAEYAIEYMRIRSWGIMAAMIGFVAAGTYRGVKDTRTPLNAAVGAMLTNMVLTPLMLYGEWGCLCWLIITFLETDDSSAAVSTIRMPHVQPCIGCCYVHLV
jgi:hypothetical protein